MVYTERAETAAVSRGTSHVSAVSTSLPWIFKKTRYKKLVTHVESHASEVSLLESGEQSYIKAINHFDKRSLFLKSAFDNVRFSAMAVFRQCPKVLLQKVLDFENQLMKTSNCVLNDMIYNS